MKNLFEFLSTKLSQEQSNELKLRKDLESSIDKNLIDKYKFEFRILKTGNVECVSKVAKHNGATGFRFMFYLYTKNKKYCLRRQYATNNKFNSVNGWSNPPANMGEFDTIQEMCDKFNKWANDKLSLA